MRAYTLVAGLFLLAVCLNSKSVAGDWPMWRYDAARSGASPDALAAKLHLRWVRELPAPRPAWPASQTKLQFDAVCQPIVVGKLVIVGSTVNDSVAAYDTESGREVWRFYTDGPVRFAPAASKNRVYAASDDGYLYCLEAKTGKLLWKVNGGPSDRRIVGNDRLISSWPIRGGPVVSGGVVYFTASIWPFMGIFVHAVDAETGRPIWTNSETGARWIVHPHGAPSFGSIVPQGYLAVAGNSVIVPGGRSLPAVFDRRNGQLNHFEFGGKGSGGWGVIGHPHFYVVSGGAYSIESGSSMGSLPVLVLKNDILIAGTNASAFDEKSFTKSEGKDRRGRNITKTTFKPKQTWPIASGGWKVYALAGHRAYAVSGEQIASFDVDAARKAGAAQEPEWSARVEGKVAEILAGDGKLFVVTDDSKLSCFGTADGDVATFKDEAEPLPQPDDGFVEMARKILDQCDSTDGYAIALGVGSDRLINEVLNQSKFHIVVVDPDPNKVLMLRRVMTQAGLYGKRIVAHVGDLSSFHFPPYLANLIFCEDLESAGIAAPERLVDSLFHPLRPYGGVVCLPLSDAQHELFAKAKGDSSAAGAKMARANNLTYLTRSGPLPQSGTWTHQYADASNSVVSQDELVKAPLGLLWFGGPPNDKVLPRHGHGPSPQVAGGRLVIEGADMLRCVDVYTGRVMWERDLPDLGKYYDTTRHFAGAGEIGSNYVTLPDAVYAVYGSKILKLDAATGKTDREISREPEGDKQNSIWGFVAAWDDLLIATASPVAVSAESNSKEKPRRIADALAPTRYSSASRRLIVMNRHSGETLWSRTAEFNFRHNCIAIAAGKIFCIDSMTEAKRKALSRRGIEPAAKPRLLVLNARTGKEIWSTDKEVFGTFLNYSVEHDVLLQAGSAYRDRARDEVGSGMIAYRGSDGKVLWQDTSRSHGGPCLLWKDKIITNGGGGSMFELLTGKSVDWKYSRMYGCNTAVGSQNLLTFRSGAAGFCDLAGDSGTGNIGGFRSSCTANLIVADGVLNAPDYTRTCSCAYQLQSSLALIHMPEAEMWTFSSASSVPDRFGVNFGAPGDRRDANGTLWFDFPSIGGRSPNLPVSIKGDNLGHYRRHASTVAPGAGTLPWVASSAVVGISSFTQELPKSDAGAQYTIRLHFSEPEYLQPGQRVFDVHVNGKPMIVNLDIAKEAGASNRGVVKQLTGIQAADAISITFVLRKGLACISGVEIFRE